MSTPKRIISLITLFLFSFTIASIDNCSTSKCNVSSPFRTTDQPPTCGLPGFDLICDFPYTKSRLFFPSSGQTFTVDSIGYYLQRIALSDPHGCLQEKLLRFDSSNTPFRFESPNNFSIYNCSRSKMPPSYPYKDFEIGCLSGIAFSVVCDKYNTYSLPTYGCLLIGYASAPGSWASRDLSHAVSVDLTWDLPEGCQRCNYGGCLRDPNHLNGTTCYASPPYLSSSQLAPHSSMFKSKRDNAIQLSLIVVVPISLAFISYGICFTLTKMSNSRVRSRGGITNDTNNLTSINPNTHSPILPSGLEQETLDTYPIILVGQSGRMLVNMEDKTCPICLLEYEPNETIKTLPECLHRFHADCIDEWLRAKALCPVCRTPPPR